MSGAKAKAKDGTLAIMVGGDAAALKRARPVLSKLGTEIFHTGKLGSGHATKALNNYLGAAGTIAGFEALLVGKKFGLDPRVLVDVINASTGKNSTTERKIPQQIFTGAFASGFQLALMTKDVGIANAIARKGGSRDALPQEHAENLARCRAPARGRRRSHGTLQIPGFAHAAEGLASIAASLPLTESRVTRFALVANGVHNHRVVAFVVNV